MATEYERLVDECYLCSIAPALGNVPLECFVIVIMVRNAINLSSRPTTLSYALALDKTSHLRFIQYLQEYHTNFYQSHIIVVSMYSLIFLVGIQD